ncbi:hypothetical protein [Desulfosudis oleivorans]|uniref:Ankyrin repeat domain-containing protein n=1 Tax=Desulfosudis oleivorans (strain DSM 6200 / JCM 39069 / Hxd3) TaxID=96561 RepID=A8ZTS0_DESOH|nr:hypothetical protein [Desulfosudis oleivorans]ABW67853.1 hypothetical protein Dole_2049 [Desulfosudis oleivorans Hxd3]
MTEKKALKLGLSFGIIIGVIALVFVLKFCISIEKTVSYEEYPSLLEAIESNASTEEILKILKKNPEAINRLQQQDGESFVFDDPIGTAALLNRKDIILLLIEHGGDPLKATDYIMNQYGSSNKEAIGLIRECIKESSSEDKEREVP